jgi:hypothetical protein
MDKNDSKSKLTPLVLKKDHQPPVTAEVNDALKGRAPITRATEAELEQSRLMLEQVGATPRTRKKKSPKPPTISEEKDLIKELQTSYSKRSEEGVDLDLNEADLGEYEKLAEFLSKPKSEIIKTLEACIEWLNQNDEQLNEIAVGLIDERLQSHAKKTQVFFVVAVQKRMESLVRIMEAADMMEVRLLDPANIWSMPMDELRKTLELMEKKTELILRQVATMIEQAGGLPKQFHDDSKMPALVQDGAKVFDDPAKRDSIRSRLDLLLQKKRLAE